MVTTVSDVCNVSNVKLYVLILKKKSAGGHTPACLQSRTKDLGTNVTKSSY